MAQLGSHIPPSTPPHKSPGVDLVLRDATPDDDCVVADPPRAAAARLSARSSLLSHIRLAPLRFPKSVYEGWRPPLPATPECKAVEDLQAPITSDEYVKLDLSSFRVYRLSASGDTSSWTGHTHGLEMESLHALRNKKGLNRLLLDGILSCGNNRRYIQAAPFSIVTLEGYGDPEVPTVTDEICIQSDALQGTSVWYHLGRPAREYRRYHETFLWVADLAKHFVDYMMEVPDVTLAHFRRQFYIWVRSRFPDSGVIGHWLATCRFEDFRTAIVANVEFLWKECIDVDKSTRAQPVWKEIYTFDAIPQQPTIEQGTVVTPFVYECFKNMYFSKYLLRRSPTSAPSFRSSIDAHRESLGFWSWESDLMEATSNAHHEESHRPSGSPTKRAGVLDLVSQAANSGVRKLSVTHVIGVGDVVGIRRDDVSVWKDNADLWFAYVQSTKSNRGGDLILDVIWLYRAADTTLGNMTYPVEQELFFSDHCNCGDGQFRASEVVCKIRIQWGLRVAGPLKVGYDFIVRQKYHSEDHSFVTMKHSDFICGCRQWESDLEEVMDKFRVGDTALVKVPRRQFLEPAVIVDFVLEAEEVVLRRLLRRKRDVERIGNTRPNELVWTDETYAVHARYVMRKCSVRFYEPERRVPPPYNRDGTADAYYITTKMERGQLVGLSAPFPAAINQGFNPDEPPPRPRLLGMELFCGGGSFGRGLEECGAVDFRWAVDIDERAIHTYLANRAQHSQTMLFWGSVNDCLSQALEGKGENSVSIPRPGDVDELAAGNPCVAFSMAQTDKMSERSLQNASLAASVVAFIDFYRPKYALIENVTAMASNLGENKDQNVFSQMLCALVGMGYQVQQFNLDAWSFGSAQSRSRLFICVTAPGLTPPPHPPLSHSHPPGKHSISLGKAINGAKFGNRRFEATPFAFVTAREALVDLPCIDDSHVQTCVPFPDHRLSRVEGELNKQLIRMIPVWPARQNYYKANKAGRIAKPQVTAMMRLHAKRSLPSSRAWTRVDPCGLISTVMTNMLPGDTFCGQWLHWDQHRAMTVMEARRAQDYPDDEVILGRPREQWKIIGNSVNRKKALALGMSLREAWLSNPIAEVEDQAMCFR